MSEQLGAMTHGELEARLADLATALAFPPTPDLAGAVAARLRAPSATITARPRVLPFPRSVRSVRRSLLLAAALALLVVGAAFAVRFGLDLLSIEFGPLPTTAPVTPSPPAPGAVGAGLGLGQTLTLDEARAAAPFTLLVPTGLDQPDAVYLGGVTLRGQVAFVYGPRDGLPASRLLGGAGLLVTQNRGEPDEGLAQKLLATGQATMKPVDVNGASGLWISGAPHFYWYLAADGTQVIESRRLVGDTLAWELDGVLYRIEGAVTLDQALEIARSMR